jgi:TPR repeat protein
VGLFAILVSAVSSASAQTFSGIEAYLAGDFDRARGAWARAAEQGDIVARFNLGMIYLQGLGVRSEPSVGIGHIRRAAIAGYAPAQFQLGMWLSSRDSGEDQADSIFWLTSAARQDHPAAAYHLGRIFSERSEGNADIVSALKWLNEAERSGIERAADLISSLESALPGNELGDVENVAVRKQLTEGRGTLEQREAFFEGQKAFIRQNYERTVEIWGPLAEAGVARAQYGIAFMLESGWGVVQNYSEAAYWYKLAAQKGHRKAQFNLGRMYVDGRGVAKDRGTGLYWIQSAADLGEPGAGEYMESLR